MNSKDYWAKRAAQDMVDRMGTAEQTAAEISAAVGQSSKYLAGEVKAVLRGIEGFGISETEAIQIIRAAGDGNALQRFRRIAQQAADPERRRALMNAIDSAGAYRYRIKRIEELYSDIDSTCRKLYQTQNRLTTAALRNVAEDSYYHTIFNLQQGTGLRFSFSKFSRKSARRILRANWLGGNYSQRIWKDMSGLSERLKQELLVSMLTGRSGEKTARIFRERFGVNAYCARRIVRTESAYVANAAVDCGYEEAGIERYVFVATLDAKTSEVCAALDGKSFHRKDAQPGTNYPPMHPFCRSTTIADFGEDTLKGLERRAKDADGNTIRVPANMTYEEWYRKYVEGIEQPSIETREAETAALPGSRQVQIAEHQTAPALLTTDNSGGQTLTHPDNGGVDVSDLYAKLASPNTGEMKYGVGFIPKDYPIEVSFANWLHRTLGGNIEILAETKTSKMADFIWNGKLWDLKNPTTEKAANSLIRKGLKQISGNPGGIFLDCGSINISLDALEECINKRMKWHKGFDVDIMIIQNGKVTKVLRYKK